MIPHTLATLLRAVAQRRRLAALLHGAALGGTATLVLALLFRDALTPVGMLMLWWTLAAAGALLAWARLDRSSRVDADRIEQVVPAAQNLVRTAVELQEQGIATDIAARVFHDADRRIQAVRAAQVQPLARVTALSALPVLGLVLVAAWRPISAGFTAMRPGAASAVPTLGALQLAVRPPSYTGYPATTVALPEQLDVLAGSTLQLSGRIGNGAVIISHGGGTDTVRGAGLAASPELVVTGDAVITLTPVGDDGRTGARHLLAVRVRDDAAPRVRIAAPARDLRVADGDRRLEVAIEASDDIALQSLALRFTRVRGAGEQFAFVEGDAMLDITRDSSDRWRARATLRLDTLRLEPGDVVVYRAIVRDTRPGTVPTESETYLVEVTAPGADAVEGFAADEDQDRYGLSQAMVILRTERLLAGLATMSADEQRRTALTLAAEQRSVRAEFVFMMGGELADDANDHAGHMHLNEEAEAEAEDDILAGRLANQGRLEMTRAIRAMSTAAQLLTAGSIREALVEERRALVSLERALSRSRFILRALNTRERVDPARRLTGNAAGVASITARAALRPATPTAVALTDASALLMRHAAGERITVAEVEAVVRTAQRLLAAFPGDTTVRNAAESMLRDLHPDVAVEQRRRTSASALVVLGSIVRAQIPMSTAHPAPLGWRGMGGGDR
jgi:hypothetical protein